MGEIRSIGVKSIKIGDAAEDGGMSTILASLGSTHLDSADMVQADPTEFLVESEENDLPEDIYLINGRTDIKFSITDYSPDTLVKVLGGTVTGIGEAKRWGQPLANANIEKSIEIVSKTGIKISVPRAKIKAKLNAKLSKKGVALVDITATVMVPKKAALLPIDIGPETEV